MKQSKIIKAYKVLNKLYEENLPLPVSYKLFKLRSQLAPQWDFQSDKERDVFSRYPVHVNENGTLVFENEEDRSAFMEELGTLCGEMAELDADIGEITKLTLSLSSGLNLSMEDIEALQDFVDFEE